MRKLLFAMILAASAVLTFAVSVAADGAGPCCS
jgi:hypothetical protein